MDPEDGRRARTVTGAGPSVNAMIVHPITIEIDRIGCLRTHDADGTWSEY